MFKLIHPQLCQITSQILFKIYEDLMIYRSQSYTDMSLDQKSQFSFKIYDHMNIAKTWATIHLEMLQKFKQLKFALGIKYVAASDDYCKIFTSMLKLFCPPADPDTSHQDASLISMSGDNHLDLLMNELKYQALQCLKIVWNYLLRKKPKDLYSTSNAYIVTAQIYLPIISNTLILLPQH